MGTHFSSMAKAVKGTLIECDPSIKSLIVKLNADNAGIVIEELDDRHLLIDSSKLPYLKRELNVYLSKNTFSIFDDEIMNK